MGKPGNSQLKKTLLGAGALVLLVLAVYLPVIHCGFVWDDDDNVTENMTLRTLGGLVQIWRNPFANQQYYPLTHTSFWIEYHLWGVSPLGYHLDNVLLHAIGVVLLWFILRWLSVPGAWLAAAIFAIHPLQVESVAWITERKNTLSGVFYFAAVLSYLRYAGIGEGRRGSYVLPLGFFVCALLSKTATSTLPAALLIILWWKRDRLSRRDVLDLAPLFVLAIFAGLITSLLEKYHAGAWGGAWNMSFAGKLIVAGKALAFYAGKLFWPNRMTFIYPQWRINPGDFRQYIYPLMAVAVPVILWLLRRRIGHSPLVAVLFFEVTLAPALGFFNVYFMQYSFVQDHFQYLAGIGAIALAVSLLARIPMGRLSIVLPAAILVCLGILTWQQIPKFRDQQTLWRDTISKNPSCWLALSHLGKIAYEQGRNDVAISYYIRAIKIDSNHAELHSNLGVALFKKGRFKEAFAELYTAVRIQPDYVDAHNNLAVAYFSQGDADQAWKEVRICRKLGYEPDPRFLADLILLKDEP